MSESSFARSASLRVSSIALFALCAAGCVAPMAEEESTASTSAEVQTSYKSRFYYDKGTTGAVRATGAVITPVLNADHTQKMQGTTPVRATCGVTFITARYAITAAHCVDSTNVWDPANQRLTVEQYDISAVSSTTLDNATKVGLFDTFPGYSHPTLTAADGYKVTSYTKCRLVHRCSTAYGKYNCPMDTTSVHGAAIDNKADIALLKCEDRPSKSPAMAVAQSDAATGPVYMNWFHEVYDMPLDAPAPPPAGASLIQRLLNASSLDKWTHYTKRTSMADNFHYMGGGKNQLLPLSNAGFPIGQFHFASSRLGVDPSSPVIWTDLFGCHGTSGSGVYQSNNGKQELLGPVALGGTAFSAGGYERLCLDANAPSAAMSKPSIAYTKAEYTSLLAKTAYSDPSEWILFPFPLPVYQYLAEPVLTTPVTPVHLQ